VVLLSPERDRGQPARIAYVARLAARGLDAAGVRRPVVAIERVAELEELSAYAPGMPSSAATTVPTSVPGASEPPDLTWPARGSA
jgi:hypothetical protein